MPGSARLFGPWYLEMFTKTTWYTVPLIWLPIAGYLLRQSVAQQLAGGVGLATTLSRTGACFLVGNFVWTVSLRSPVPAADLRTELMHLYPHRSLNTRCTASCSTSTLTSRTDLSSSCSISSSMASTTTFR